MAYHQVLIGICTTGLIGLASWANASTVPVTTGLVGYYDGTQAFTDSGGTNAAAIGDSIALLKNQAPGGGNDATQTSMGSQPTLVAGAKPGTSAIDFSTSFLTSTLNISPGGTATGFTFFVVGKSNGPGGANGGGGGLTSVLRFQDSGGSYVVYPYTLNGNNDSTLIVSSDGGVASGIGGGNLSDGAYHVGAAVYQSNTTDGMQTYLDNVLQTQRDTGMNPLPSNSLTIGRYNPGGTEYTNGNISALLIYNQALSFSQIQQVDAYLQSTYLPEPGALGLLGASCISVLRRRRCRSQIEV